VPTATVSMIYWRRCTRRRFKCRRRRLRLKLVCLIGGGLGVGVLNVGIGAYKCRRLHVKVPTGRVSMTHWRRCRRRRFE